MTPGYDFVMMPGPDGTYEMRPVPRDMDTLERHVQAEMGLIFLTVVFALMFCGVLAVTWLLMSLIL